MAETYFGVNSYPFTLTYTAGETVTRLCDCGYRTFELMMYPGHLWPGETDTSVLARLVAGRGARIATLNMPNVDINIAAVADESRALSLDMVSRLVRLAGELGAGGVVVGPGKANPLLPAPPDLLESHLLRALDVLAPLAETHATAVFVENLPFGFLPRADDLMEILDRHGDPRVGVCYDVANAEFVGENPADGLRRVRDRLRLVHVSDTGRDVYRHDAVGTGSVAFDRLPAVLDEIGYDEVAMLEIISPAADDAIDVSARRLAAMGWRRGEKR
jgi:L-ribulose-5-phosphate 3-epimerase